MLRARAGAIPSSDAYASACVRRFVEDTHVLGERAPEQWQQDAFGQIDALLRPLSGPTQRPRFSFRLAAHARLMYWATADVDP